MDRGLANKLRFHLARLVEDPDPARVEHWEQVARCAGELAGAADGAAPRVAREARARLREHALDRRQPHDAAILLRELAPRPGDAPSAASGAPEPAERLVARLLAGRSLVVVGGDTGREHGERWREAFGLREVHWRGTTKTNPSIAAIEPLIARPEVAAVLVLIRWARHATVDALAAACARHEKPLVRVTAGYHPAKLAQEILRQCGQRLEHPDRP
jgi:hypothetical protein